MTDEHENTSTPKIPDWPIEPTFLSLREGITDKYSASPNKDGLFYANELRGILADAAATIWEEDGIDDIGSGRNFALFQVVPEEFIPFIEKNGVNWFDKFTNAENDIIRTILNDEKIIIRIYPGNLYPNFKCCEQFRKCKDKDGCECKNKCFEMDSRIALLYDEKLRMIPENEHGESDWDKFHDRLKDITDKYNEKITEEYKMGKYKEDVDNIELYLLQLKKHEHKYKGKTESRPYVGYRCIYSGLMEYFFPIIHAGKIIAVLMHGQCAPGNLKKEEMFKNYRTETLNQLIEEKEEKDKTEKDVNKKFFYLPEDYIPIAKKQFNLISGIIKRLEERVENEVKARSQKYVSSNFFEIERNFRNLVGEKENNLNDSGDKLEDLRKAIANSDEDLKEYKKKLNLTLKEIIKRFILDGFIRIYAIESPIANRVNPKKDGFNLIGDSDFDKNSSHTYSKIIFNRIKERKGTLNERDLLDVKSGQEEPYFPKRYWRDLQTNDILHVEFSLSSQIAYLIWERYDNLNMESEQYREYNDYLKLMYHTLLEPYIIFERMKLEKDLENTMRISSHESAQIIPEVIDTINGPESLAFLKKEEIGIYRGPGVTISGPKIIDTSRRLLLLNTLFKRLSRIFKEEKPKLEYSDFHRIIYAPESLYFGKAYSGKYMSMTVKGAAVLKAYSLRTDYEELSHILFNLTDNAIKYGLQGSNIVISVALLNWKKITISIISYGDKIKNEDREKMFELYYRSKKAKGTEGMGIGLFLVKKLCNLLGYEVECIPSEAITPYNLPLKYHYCMQNPESAWDTFLFPETYKILKTPDPMCVREVVNTNDLSDDWEITDFNLEWGPEPKLFQPTYKNEFKITIPIKEGDLKEI